MFAVLVSVTIDPERQEDAKAELTSNVVPRVSQLPGAVAGYWLAPTDGHGYSTIVFESEEQARAAAEAVPNGLPQAVTLDFVDVKEIVASF
jgi:hypothetical protein